MLGLIKDNGKVLCICDSINVHTESNKLVDNNSYCWTPKGLKHTIILSEMGFYHNIFIRTMDNLFDPEYEDEICKEYIMKEIVCRINGTFKKYGELKGYIEKTKFPLFIATKDRIYQITNRCHVREIDEQNFYTGTPFIDATLDEIKEEDLTKKILIALYIYHKYSYPICFPLVIKDTETLEATYYEYDDLENAYKEYVSRKED